MNFDAVIGIAKVIGQAQCEVPNSRSDIEYPMLWFEAVDKDFRSGARALTNKSTSA